MAKRFVRSLNGAYKKLTDKSAYSDSIVFNESERVITSHDVDYGVYTDGYLGNTLGTVRAGKDVVVTDKTTEDNIHYTEIAHKTITTSIPAATSKTLEHSGKFTVYYPATVDNGHVTQLTPIEYTLPSDNNDNDKYSFSDDNVVDVTTGTKSNGTTPITINHAKKGPSSGYTSGNATTSIGAGDSKTIKIPQLTVDSYGHVTAGADESVTITIPASTAHPNNFNFLGLSNGTQSTNYSPKSSEDSLTIAYSTSDDISITGTRNDELKQTTLTFSHDTSGVTAGSYGPSANADPQYNGTFSVPYFTVNDKGHITAASTKTITMPDPVTPGDGTLTIKANGASKGTFSANQSTNATIDITAADLGLSQVMQYIGKTTTALSDGATTNPITIDSKLVTAKQGNVVIDSNDKKEYIWNGSKWEEFGNEGNYKVVQTAVSDPTKNGTTLDFIATISQDANGVITPTKSTVPTAGTSLGVVKTTSTVTSTSGLTASPIVNGVVYYKDTNTAHSHAAGVGLTLADTNTGGTSGTVTYKTKLKSETAHTASSATPTNTVSRQYAVGVDKDGYLSVNVPWENDNDNTTYSAGKGLTLSGTTFNVGAGTGISVGDDTVGLTNTGVTAASYGPASNASPNHSGTFSVPYFTVDAQGRITAASTKTITLPASGDTHHQAKNIISNSASGTSETSSNLTNGNVYLNLIENGTKRSSHKIQGINGTIVTYNATTDTMEIDWEWEVLS